MNYRRPPNASDGALAGAVAGLLGGLLGGAALGRPGAAGAAGPAGPAGPSGAGSSFIPYGLSQTGAGETWVTPGYEPNTPANDFLGFPLPFSARPVALTYSSDTAPLILGAPVTLTLTALNPVSAFLDVATVVIPAGAAFGRIAIVSGVTVPLAWMIGLRQLAGDFGDLEAMGFVVEFERV